MGSRASQITSLTIVYSTVYSDADQRKQQSSASLAFVRRTHQGPVYSPHKWPVTRKMFSFDDVIMNATFCNFIHSDLTMAMFMMHIYMHLQSSLCRKFWPEHYWPFHTQHRHPDLWKEVRMLKALSLHDGNESLQEFNCQFGPRGLSRSSLSDVSGGRPNWYIINIHQNTDYRWKFW